MASLPETTMGDEENDTQFPHHKLCGYVLTALALPPAGPTSLPFLAQCNVSCSAPSQPGWLCPKAGGDGGVVLLPVADASEDDRSPGKRQRRRRRRRGMGMVNGSLSVVHQISALVSYKCVQARARVLRVEGARVVVLVDVYLPLAAWDGWQFPRSGSVAGSLFRHLSCDWEKRSSLLVSGGVLESLSDAFGGNSVRDLPDCHVLGCTLHREVPDPSWGSRFELFEIFRSLRGAHSKWKCDSSRMEPANGTGATGIWDVTDDIIFNILSRLGPVDLVRVAATCRHLRSAAVLVMPCMKLKLFPHQQAAVEWMLQRERNAEDLPHPLCISLNTHDGFSLYVNTISGEIITGKVPKVRDFRGGMFCDEPGMGKTITALSLILKTQGTMADPPDSVQVTWCSHEGNWKCGYYDISSDKCSQSKSLLGKRFTSQIRRRVILSDDSFNRADGFCSLLQKRARYVGQPEKTLGSNEPCLSVGPHSPLGPYSEPALRCTRSLSQIKKNLMYEYEEASSFCNKVKIGENSNKRKLGKEAEGFSAYNETWVQCDACRKWRKLNDAVPHSTASWYCSMNSDTSHQSCNDLEESWDKRELITHLRGFCAEGTFGGLEENVSFFISVLKEHYSAINSKTKRALMWLANLSCGELSKMATIGLLGPFLNTYCPPGREEIHEFHKICEAFGFRRSVEKHTSRWYYPRNIGNLVFDLVAFRIALSKPLDSVRMYLSRATLIVVPTHLVDHWKTQIQKHVKPFQLRVCIWTDHREPSAHTLAWDYDVVITTFTRLSAEWGPNKKSPLMHVHWLRVILDEGHTLGSSLSLTNKLQMVISFTASNRWLLTGTPMPNSPDSQLSHLHPMLKFLHEEAYGWNQKSWEAGILRPFEAEMEEGRSRLLQLLDRCLISARKEDLKTIPPCIRKVTFLNFTTEHARSYNELVVTVRRNILTCDWNDPSHIESLLNPKQWKFRNATVRNVRLSCCVAGHIKLTEAGKDILETMDLLVEKGLDPMSEEYAFIKYALQNGGNCIRCKEWCRMPFITPCRHILCVACVALDSERCAVPGCGFLYEMETPKTRAENPKPKWPVPKDLIELQPSYKQDLWDPDWRSTSSSKVAYLVRRLRQLHKVDGDSFHFNGEGTDAPCITMQYCPSNSRDSTRLCSARSALMAESYDVCDKVIVFSQFLEHFEVIEQQLTLAGIKFVCLSGPMHSAKKVKSLETFRHDPTCMVLVMDGSAALGLDLSFVTHVFLMEPIWDKSMEEQVVSRAHRMGATRPIHVETLAMRGTIEEQMVEFLQDASECTRLVNDELNRSDREGARPHTVHDFAETKYIAKLSFVPITAETEMCRHLQCNVT